MGHAHASHGCPCCADMFASARESRQQDRKPTPPDPQRERRLNVDGFDRLLFLSEADAASSVPGITDLPGARPHDAVIDAEVKEAVSVAVEAQCDSADCSAPDVVSLSIKLDVTMHLLREAKEQLEGSCFRLGYLQSQLEEKDRQIKLLTAPVKKDRLWSRLSAWLVCR